MAHASKCSQKMFNQRHIYRRPELVKKKKKKKEMKKKGKKRKEASFVLQHSWLVSNVIYDIWGKIILQGHHNLLSSDLTSSLQYELLYIIL